MICSRCPSITIVIMALAGERNLTSRQPYVFVQSRCEQGHYFSTLRIFDGTIYEEHYLTSDEQNLDIKASYN